MARSRDSPEPEETVTYRAGDDESPAEAVVSAVAAAEGDPGGRLLTGPPLYDVVDPDALAKLFRPTSRGPRPSGRVAFVYAGWEVVVHATGRVDVERADADR